MNEWATITIRVSWEYLAAEAHDFVKAGPN